LPSNPSRPVKGRAALANPEPRFQPQRHESCDDGWQCEAEGDSLLQEVLPEMARSIIARNDSPDIPFTQSINPYRGCEHGCIYCFARPTHAYLDLSPGLDFERRIRFKPNAAALLEQELAHPRYRCEPINLGSNTDPYQPVERRFGLTRQILEICARTAHPVSIVTKSALVMRDIDLLQSLAARRLCHVHISITTLDDELKRVLEPRTASGNSRLRTVRALSERGIPVGVMVAPVIPMLNDAEMESIVERAADAGAAHAGWILLRLPLEVAPLFREWLAEHYPARAAHIMSLINQSRGGRDNDPRFGSRMRGAGLFAELIARRFRIALRRTGLDRREWTALDCAQFVAPRPAAPQMDLF
jgi:DNA repair photolyase